MPALYSILHSRNGCCKLLSLLIKKKKNHNLEGWDGVGGKREIHEGGDICIPMADSC